LISSPLWQDSCALTFQSNKIKESGMLNEKLLTTTQRSGYPKDDAADQVRVDLAVNLV
jgi:hypothetical protein